MEAQEANKKYWARQDKVKGKGYTKDFMEHAHKTASKSKALKKYK